MKPKFQPMPRSTSVIQKWATVMPDRPTIAAEGDQHEPGRRYPPLAEPGDQAAGEEARSEHGQDVPLDAQRRRADRMAAADHREGRGRHHEAHEAVGDQARDHRHDEAGLPDDLASGAGRQPWASQRSPASAAGTTRRHRQEGQRRLPEEGAGEGRRLNRSRVQITV